jgi:hypothetical protein
MGDNPTLVRFITGWAQDGLGADGLPYFREVLKVVKSRPPYLQLEQVATEEDISDNADAYARFQKEQAAKKLTSVEGGFPLALWPAVGGAELQMLSARDIVTVEELAKWAGRRAEDGMPGELKELAKRAKAMVDMSKDIGKYEAIIREKDGQLEALVEQVKDLRSTIQAQDGIINSLKAKVA